MTESAIVTKIKKLLEMAGHEGSDPNEAAVAAQMARDLMEKYAIEEAELELRGEKVVKEPIQTQALGWTYRRIPMWRTQLLKVLSTDFYCRVFYRRGVDAYVVGRESDRAALIATFDYVAKTLERMCDFQFALYEGPVHGISWKTAFFTGAINTIDERLFAAREKSKPQVSSETAIVLVNRQQEVDKWMEENIKLRKRQAQRRSVVADGYYAGAAAGAKVNLDRRASKALGE